MIKPVLQNGIAIGGPLELILPQTILDSEFIPRISLPEFGSDRYWMFQALQESLSGAGITAPNPAVGCVIVDSEGREISRGATQAYPGMHAERAAFQKVQDPTRLKDATLYITLEPCSHHGNQPPCVDLIKNSPIRRVVIARGDPNPKVDGQGISQLREAGKEIQIGLYSAEVSAWNFPFFAQQALNRPVILLKWAQTLDGQLADDSDHSHWITGKPARSYAHWLRQRSDAILVGARTVLADLPKLNVRDCQPAHPKDPLPILFDPHGLCFTKLKQSTLFQGRPTIVVTLRKTLDQHRSSELNSLKETEIITLLGKNPILELKEFFNQKSIDRILGRPLQTILVEGGPKTLSSLIQNEIGDAFHLFIAPLITGGIKNRIQTRFLLKTAPRLELLSTHQLGSDALLEMIPTKLFQKIFVTQAP